MTPSCEKLAVVAVEDAFSMIPYAARRQINLIIIYVTLLKRHPGYYKSGETR